jgi:hypothetical protein
MECPKGWIQLCVRNTLEEYKIAIADPDTEKLRLQLIDLYAASPCGVYEGTVAFVRAMVATLNKVSISVDDWLDTTSLLMHIAAALDLGERYAERKEAVLEVLKEEKKS